jgi:glutamyl-tRNA reductase
LRARSSSASRQVSACLFSAWISGTVARGDDAGDVLDALARSLTQKMLHGAYAELNAADAAQREQVADAVSRLFLRRTPRTPDSTPDNGGDTQL